MTRDDHEFEGTWDDDLDYTELDEYSRADLIRRAAIAGVSVSTLAALAGAGSSKAGMETILSASQRRGGTLRIGITAPNGPIEPWTAFGAGANFTYMLAAESLAFPRADYTLAPKLATSWRPGRTPRVWTFQLRRGVRWHDGRPFTADDVVATFNTITKPDSGALAQAALSGVLRPGQTQKVDPHTVRFNLDRAVVQFPYLVSGFTFGSVILPRGYRSGTFQQGSIGTGPFILRRVNPGRSATFVRNPRFWSPGLPYLNQIELVYFSDDAAIGLALQAGEIDIYPSVPYSIVDSLHGRSGVRVMRARSSRYDAFNMRTDQPPFNDKRVRQAVALCLNRPALIRGIFKGFQEVGNDHSFAPIYPDSRLVSRVPQRRQNYARARSLLAAAGHGNGLKVTFSAQNAFENSQLLVFVKAQCAPAGIDVTTDLQDPNVFYGGGSAPPWLNLPFTLVEWGARGFAGQAAHPAFECGGVWNSAHWCNRRWTQTLNAIDRETNNAKRQALVLQAARIQQDATPAIIATWYNELRAARSRVRGLAAGPASFLDPTRLWVA